jgi:CHAD domain-containing protein
MNKRVSSSGLIFSDYLSREVNSFRVQCGDLKKEPNKTLIHQFRVGIKKIRCALQFLEMLLPDKINVREMRLPLRHVFKISGNLREIQMNLLNLKLHEINQDTAKEYYHFLKKRKNKYIKKFNKEIIRIDPSVLEIPMLMKSCREMDDLETKIICRKYLKKQAIKIRQLLATGNSPVMLHKARAQLKSLIEIGLLHVKTSPDEVLKKMLIQLKKIAIQIGNWHDKIVLINSIRHFLGTNKKLHKKTISSLSGLSEKFKMENHLFIGKAKFQIEPILKAMAPELHIKQDRS